MSTDEDGIWRDSIWREPTIYIAAIVWIGIFLLVWKYVEMPFFLAFCAANLAVCPVFLIATVIIQFRIGKDYD